MGNEKSGQQPKGIDERTPAAPTDAAEGRPQVEGSERESGMRVNQDFIDTYGEEAAAQLKLAVESVQAGAHGAPSEVRDELVRALDRAGVTVPEIEITSMADRIHRAGHVNIDATDRHVEERAEAAIVERGIEES